MQKLSWYLSKYNKNSLGILVFLILAYGAVIYYWRSIVTVDNFKDPLLWIIWAFMTAVLCWNIDPKRDLPRMAVGLLGGLIIEAWGTHTELWTYYTNERPPLWIIPAWPVAAIAIDRIARALDFLCSRIKLEYLWWFIWIGFLPLMLEFVWPTIDKWTTWFAISVVLISAIIPGDRRLDVCLMLAGSGLGVFLEYWGTSRYCWTYYTQEIPPVFAVFAHGIASIAFQRGAVVLVKTLAFWRDKLMPQAAVVTADGQTVLMEQADEPAPANKSKKKRKRKVKKKR